MFEKALQVIQNACLNSRTTALDGKYLVTRFNTEQLSLMEHSLELEKEGTKGRGMNE